MMLAPVMMHPQDSQAEFKDPPHNFAAEQALLGAILVDNRAFDDLADFLKPLHFADPVHGDIFEAISDTLAKSRKATPVTLKHSLSDHPGLKAMGGDEYLMRLAGAAASIINAKDYARLIFELAMRRELIGAAEDLANDAFDTSQDFGVAGVLDRHESALLKVSRGGEQTEGLRDFKSFADEAVDTFEELYKNRGKVMGLSTGIADLDRRLGGMRQSDLLILGGRPAMGKTALGTGAGVSVARTGKRVAFFSLEMSGKQLAGRVLSAHAGVPIFKAMSGDITSDDVVRMAEARDELRDLCIHIDDTGARTVPAMRAECRRLARRRGVDMVIVDYIGLASPADPRSNKQKVHQIEEITNGLKALAKELDVPVLALCQLSRSLEAREDKRPMLSDLRDSGSIEQDADVVMFVFREQYYLERAEPQRRGEEGEEKYQHRVVAWEKRLEQVTNTAEIIIAKNRFGPTGTARAHFDGALTKFGNLYSPADHQGDQWHDR